MGIYLFKINRRNTRTRGEICSKLTIKITDERHHWCYPDVFVVNFTDFTACSGNFTADFEHIYASLSGQVFQTGAVITN